EVKQFAKAVADAFVAHAPRDYIATMSKTARRGKIFIDYLRNERGSTAVVAYSTRARSGAPVSTPLAWEELPKLKGPAQYTLQNVVERLGKLKQDPWKELTKRQQVLSLHIKQKLRY